MSVLKNKIECFVIADFNVVDKGKPLAIGKLYRKIWQSLYLEHKALDYIGLEGACYF